MSSSLDNWDFPSNRLHEGKERLNLSCEKNKGTHRRRKVDEKSCVTPAGTSNEFDIQNKLEENTRICWLRISCEKNEGTHRRRKVDEKSCVTPAGTSNEFDIQNNWKKTHASVGCECLPAIWALRYMCVCFFFPFILDITFVGRTSRSHTGFSILFRAVRALIFLARKIQPLLSLVDREVEFCVLMI